MSRRYAIDIVLLPDEKTTARGIELSEGIVNRKNAKRLFLNRVDRIPHISLAMGVVSEQGLATLNAGIGDLCSTIEPVPLTARPIATAKSPTDAIALVRIERSEALDALHNSAMAILAPMRQETVAPTDFAGVLPEGGGSVAWVQGFEANAAFQNYSPHITLGYGSPTQTSFPGHFLADRLAVCHLGEHCTCSKILFERPLQLLT